MSYNRIKQQSLVKNAIIIFSLGFVITGLFGGLLQTVFSVQDSWFFQCQLN
ncbi:hypothetical protein VAA_00980 [Vibrio anguillarum 775]|nr:hypothetical protein VAA_00980 [Vibrio anguillarum 775]